MSGVAQKRDVNEATNTLTADINNVKTKLDSIASNVADIMKRADMVNATWVGDVETKMNKMHEGLEAEMAFIKMQAEAPRRGRQSTASASSSERSAPAQSLHRHRGSSTSGDGALRGAQRARNSRETRPGPCRGRAPRAIDLCPQTQGRIVYAVHAEPHGHRRNLGSRAGNHEVHLSRTCGNLKLSEGPLFVHDKQIKAAEETSPQRRAALQKHFQNRDALARPNSQFTFADCESSLGMWDHSNTKRFGFWSRPTKLWTWNRHECVTMGVKLPIDIDTDGQLESQPKKEQTDAGQEEDPAEIALPVDTEMPGERDNKDNFPEGLSAKRTALAATPTSAKQRWMLQAGGTI